MFNDPFLQKFESDCINAFAECSDQMDFETIVFEEKDHIGLLTLNRPKTINA